MKETILGVLGAIGSAIAGYFGGWTSAMTTLIILMAADYITGIMVAALWKKSPKSETGGLDSNAGWKGLAKKCMILLFVYIAARLDLVMGTTYLKDAVCIAYIINELLSLVENAGLMGVPIPSAITNAIDALKKRSSTEEAE